MKEKILNYIHEYNKTSQITIEYAVLEPFLNPTGNTIYNLHVVYSPKIEFLTRTYLTGISSGDWPRGEQIVTGFELAKVLHQFPLISGAAKHATLPYGIESSIEQFSCSNMARFYNFKFNSPTDPFLLMFLENENIIYISDDFKEYFFDQRDSFKPHPIYMLEVMSVSLKELVKASSDYQYRTDRTKVNCVLQELHKTMRLYFIALRYYNTKELVSSFEEKYNLILNTLAQASRPWEFVDECVKFIDAAKQKDYFDTTGNSYAYQQHSVEFSERVNATKERELLKQQCFNFLAHQIKREISAS